MDTLSTGGTTWEIGRAPPSRLFASFRDDHAHLLGMERTLPVTEQEEKAEGGLTPSADERLVEIYRRARDPDDPKELRNLFLGRIETELRAGPRRAELAGLWAARPPVREFDEQAVLSSRATARFIKELFNWFFRDDLYGGLRSPDHLILSSGSVDETIFGLPPVLKACVGYALQRDWYGYSDSRGRNPAREAIAAFENERIEGEPYGFHNVAIAMGGTFAISALADFLLGARPVDTPALCALPNYPPLVEAVARRAPIRLVPLSCRDGVTSLEPLIQALQPSTPLVLLQTVTNPTGTAVDEQELARVLRAAGPATSIVLDECHECMGPPRLRCRERAGSNVVRVSSMSKTFSTPGLKVGWILADRRLIDDFYEYASTTYGGPPSFFYTLVEVAARMERWRLLGLEAPGSEHLAEFERDYGITRGDLAAAYRSYHAHRLWRDQTVIDLRDGAWAFLHDIGLEVVRPQHSMNLAVRLNGWNDGYLVFRELLQGAGVAPFPGVLTYCLAGGWIRLTTARDPGVLALALRRLADFAQRRNGEGAWGGIGTSMEGIS